MKPPQLPLTSKHALAQVETFGFDVLSNVLSASLANTWLQRLDALLQPSMFNEAYICTLEVMSAEMVVRSSHSPKHPSWKMTVGDAIESCKTDVVIVCAQAGDVVVLHPSVLHRPGVNSTARRRRVLSSQRGDRT